MACCCAPEKKMWWEKHAPVTSYEGIEVTTLNADQIIRHHQQRRWYSRIRCCASCVRYSCDEEVRIDVSSTLAEMFTHFRGYVPSDIYAGISLHAMQNDSKVSSIFWNQV